MNDPEEKWERLQDQFNTLLDENAALRARVVEWVSVEDRLPDGGIDVLVLIDNGNVSIAGIDTCWSPEITHWMPLPQAPDEVR